MFGFVWAWVIAALGIRIFSWPWFVMLLVAWIIFSLIEKAFFQQEGNRGI